MVMSYKNTHYLSVFVPSVLLGFIAALQLTGCSDAPVGLSVDDGGASGKSAHGGAAHGTAGATSKAGAGSKAGASSKPGEGGEAGAVEGGEAGEAAGGTSGNPEGGTANGGTIDSGGGTTDIGGADGTPVTGGTGGTWVEAVILPTCTFHTDAALSAGGAAGAPAAGGAGGAGGGGGASGGSAGAAGAPGPAPTVTLQASPFVGSYLADATGRTLYTYGNDLPGDCNTPPVSNCVTDCLISWPIFPANSRVLAAGLDDAAFGAIQRADGAWQTTYYGWPIYYYKTDLLLGQVAGQGKAKTWHIVEKKPPGVNIMKPGTFRYLGDVSGHTLYVNAADQPGTAMTDPISNCSGECLATFEPFHEKNFSVVTSLLMADFSTFVRPGRSTIHVAYKGMPLYRAITDLKSGDMTGTSISGFTAALP
jgi:predicted lipoprotein with Yx(FWY)xxD motif